MPDLFLESYDGQSTDELLALEGRYRIDSLVLAFEQAIQLKPEPSAQERCVLAVEALEREVNNGGYLQFFLNSSGEFAGIVEAALRDIGCPKTADITRDAVGAIAADGNRNADVLSDRAANAGHDLEGALAGCNDRYFSNDEAIADRLFEWIKANRAAIRVGDA